MTATPWHLGMLAPLDFESTGVDTREARIVTGYTAVLLGRDRGRGLASRPTSLVVDPGIPIPPGATEVHGVTDEMARAGVAADDGVNTFAEEVARALQARIPVVGHNLTYDLSLLYWECLRHDLPTVAERLGYLRDAPVGPIIDTYVLDKHFDQFRRGSRKLDDSKGPGVATRYGVPLGRAHTADADAIAAARVAVAIAVKYAGPDLPTDAAQLHPLEKLWAFDQRTSLERHFRKKNPDARVDRCWPICTDPSHPS